MLVVHLLSYVPLQEPHTVQVWQQKFGFKKLSPRALKSLQSAVPALNFYEESTLLSKPLAKKRQAASKKQHKSQKEQQKPALVVEPLQLSLEAAAAGDAAAP